MLAEMNSPQFIMRLEDVLPSDAYLVRPYVNLKGQRNGYRFSGNRNDLWRAFLNAKVKKFVPEITGNKCQSENAVSNALFKGLCRVDAFKYKTSIGKCEYFFLCKNSILAKYSSQHVFRKRFNRALFSNW